MVREKLPGRRSGYNLPIVFKKGEPGEVKTFITVNISEETLAVREVFCADPRVGSDLHALLTDGCILISLYLQTGGDVEKLPRTLGGNRTEGQLRGPPASILGQIAREVLELQQNLMEAVNEKS